MKRIFIIFLIIIFLCGCDDRIYYWNFRKNYSEIQEISIIKIAEYKSPYQVINEHKIKIIDNSQYENFYNEINNMKMKKIFRTELDHPSNYCFLISYDDKNYCILSEFGSGYFYYNDSYNTLDFEYGDLDFDKVEFSNLLNKYLEDNN